MNSYGWALKEAMSYTFYQLETMFSAIHRRKYDDYIMLTNISRISQADKDGFTNFIDGLKEVRDCSLSKKKSEEHFEGFKVGTIQ